MVGDEPHEPFPSNESDFSCSRPGSRGLLQEDVTQILSAMEQGDTRAAAQLPPLVYEELRKLAAVRMAREKPGQTLQATALVHEAFVRLVDVDQLQHWESRGHFYAAAAEAMRRILVDRARHKNTLRAGGNAQRVDTNAVHTAVRHDQFALWSIAATTPSHRSSKDACRSGSACGHR